MIRVLPDWLAHLEAEDLNFLRRFVLHSGSLKALAADYGVSYPTIRQRLDRLIDKIKLIESQAATSEFEQILRMKFADGRIDRSTFEELMEAFRAESREDKHD